MTLERAKDASAKLLLIMAIYLPRELSAQVVANGGFETGSFSGWTQSGNAGGASVSAGSAYVHSGQRGAALGASGSLGYLSQTILTTPGTTYVLSFWLDSQGGAPNEFLVSWNGGKLFDQVDLGVTGWTNLQFAIESAASNTLQFGFRNDPSYFGLDDVQIATTGSFYQLAFTVGPSGTNAGAVFAPVVVQAEDVAGNPIATNGVTVTMALNSGTGGLGGTVTQITDPTGKATFNDLSVDLSGVKTLRVSAAFPSVVPATSGPFLITPSAASQLALLSMASSPQVAGIAFSPGPVVQVLDRFGNVATNSTAAISAALSSSGGGSLGGAATVDLNGVNGLATFSNLRYNLANPGLAESVVVYFTSPGLSPVTNNPVMVDFGFTDLMITLTNGNSVAQIDPTSQDGVFSWSVDGTDQLYQQWFWLRQDPFSAQVSFDQLGAPLGLIYSSSNAAVNFLAPGLNVTLSFTLNGGAAGSSASELTETISIENLNSSPVGLHVYDYADFDLDGQSAGDTVLFPAVGTVLQQGKGMAATQTAQGPEPAAWEASWYALTFDKIEGATPAILSDGMTPNEAGDQTFASQWDFTLAAGQTFVVNLANSIRLGNGGGPGPALLRIARLGSDVLLSWPTNAGPSAQLQSSGKLGPGGGWMDVTNQPATAGAQYQVTLPRAGIEQFYRLQQ